MRVVKKGSAPNSENGMRSANLTWNPKLAHLRFLAALLVFLFHGAEIFHKKLFADPPVLGGVWITDGYTGVTLFFVLSGYLFMSISLTKEVDINYVLFLKNRVLRIFPLFCFFFFVAISIDREHFRPFDIFSLLFSNLGDSVTGRVPLTGAAWTISIELTFYILFPFLAKFTRDYGNGFLLKLIVLLVLTKFAAYFSAEKPVLVMYLTLVGRFDQFLVGMLAASISNSYLPRDLGGKWALAAFLVIWAALELLARCGGSFSRDGSYRLWIVWPSIEAALWSFVVIAYSRWEGNFPEAIGSYLEKGGEMSFSLYLWHFTVLFMVQKFFYANWTAVVSDFAYIAGAFAILWVVSMLSYDVIEKPFLNLRGKYL